MSRAGRAGVLLVVALAAIALRWRLVHDAAIEPDEFQHLHAAYLVASGARPYVDFFEHHSPLFYLLGGALIDPARATFDTILRFREGVLAWHFAGVAAGVALAWRHGARTATIAVIFLVVEFFSFAYGAVLMLDSLAAPLLLGGAAAVAWRPRSGAAWLAAGVLHGAALLFTQKALYATAAPVCWWTIGWAIGARAWPGVRAPALFVAGVVGIVAVTFAYLGGAISAAFWENAVVLNVRWTARRWPLGEAFMIASYGAAIWTLAGLGLLRAAARAGERLVPPLAALYVLAMAGGIVVTPVVWYEYFVEMGPFVAILAAWLLAEAIAAAERSGPVVPPWVRWTGLAVGAATILSLGLRSWSDHYSPLLSWPGLVTAVVGTAVAVGATVATWRRRQVEWAAVAAAGAIVVLPVVLETEWFHRLGNAQQRSGVQFVLEHSAPTDAVFDGYSGFGVFRPHAYRYWFLHDEVLAMLRATPPGPDAEIATALRQPAVRLVVVDPYTRTLGAEVWSTINAEFEPRWHGELWVRRSARDGEG